MGDELRIAADKDLWCRTCGHFARITENRIVGGMMPLPWIWDGGQLLWTRSGMLKSDTRQRAWGLTRLVSLGPKWSSTAGREMSCGFEDGALHIVL